MAADSELSLALSVVSILRRNQIHFALIGASALAVYGHARATYDVDIMVATPNVFQLPWESELPGTSIDIRHADFDDPLGGVIRFTAALVAPVDVVVGKWAWEASVLSRCIDSSFGGVQVPVPALHDLVLLKIAAGGPQDLVDATELASDDPDVASRLRAIFDTLPEALRRDVETFLNRP